MNEESSKKKRMVTILSTNLPKIVVDMWENGLKAKEQGLKEEAMKEFLGYYDMLNIFLQSYNLPYSPEFLKTRQKAVEQEIRELMLDEDYLRATIIPEEGIREIKAAVGLGGNTGEELRDQYELLEAPIYVKRPTLGTLEVEQLTLMEYQNEKWSNERVLKIKISCEGRTAEFLYDRVHNNPIPLPTIAKRILKSTGADFKHQQIGDHQVIILNNYLSLRNFLEDYLVRGGWIFPEEAESIEVIGYPSTKINPEEVFGLEELTKSNQNRKGRKKPKRPTPKKSPFRPRRRR
jgi:hypothetical protein